MRKFIFWLPFCLTVFLFLTIGTAAAASWHYDFAVGEDISALTVVNPTGQPTVSLDGSLLMHMPARSGGGYGGYDLASWVNLHALRLFRAGGGEPFTLETKLSTSFTGGTFLSGLFLYRSSDGVSSNDFIFGASSGSLKIERGNPTDHDPPLNWLTIGSYDELYLQVVHDGTKTTFNYKTSTAGAWQTKGSLSGYTFDQVGIITKTWYNKYGGSSPVVDAHFDYLYYNYTPPTVPLPGSLLILGSSLLGLAGLRRFMQS